MDTSCLAVIVGHWKKLAARGGTLALAGARYRYTKTLWITGLADRLPMFETCQPPWRPPRRGMRRSPAPRLRAAPLTLPRLLLRRPIPVRPDLPVPPRRLAGPLDRQPGDRPAGSRALGEVMETGYPLHFGQTSGLPAPCRRPEPPWRRPLPCITGRSGARAAGGM